MPRFRSFYPFLGRLGFMANYSPNELYLKRLYKDYVWISLGGPFVCLLTIFSEEGMHKQYYSFSQTNHTVITTLHQVVNTVNKNPKISDFYATIIYCYITPILNIIYIYTYITLVTFMQVYPYIQMLIYLHTKIHIHNYIYNIYIYNYITYI